MMSCWFGILWHCHSRALVLEGRLLAGLGSNFLSFSSLGSCSSQGDEIWSWTELLYPLLQLWASSQMALVTVSKLVVICGNPLEEVIDIGVHDDQSHGENTN